MMKYSRKGSTDWVELAGCDELPMREIDALYTAASATAFEIAKGVIKDWSMTVKGAAVAVGEMLGLTLKQWDWLRERIVEAAREEAIDPEA